MFALFEGPLSKTSRRMSCPLAALLGERYNAARPARKTQEDLAKVQMIRYREADLLEVKGEWKKVEKAPA